MYCNKQPYKHYVCSLNDHAAEKKKQRKTEESKIKENLWGKNYKMKEKLNH